MKRFVRLLTRAWIPIVCLSVGTACAAFAQTPPPVYETDSQLTFASSDMAMLKGASIFFVSTAGPADFFKALRRTETASGSKYMKDSDEVRLFPEHLVIEVIAVEPEPLLKKKAIHEVMNELHFDGHWKRGMYLRPVKNLALQSKLPTYSSSSSGESWRYYLDLDDSEVPLDDHLILDIFAADNKRIARMSLALR